MTPAQIKHMVDRFLNWRLPANFTPDNGITAVRPNYHPNVQWEPMGTNLLDATQADAMVRHMIEGLPQSAPETRETGWVDDLRPIIKRTSPSALYAFSVEMSIPYERLMEWSGQIVSAPERGGDEARKIVCAHYDNGTSDPENGQFSGGAGRCLFSTRDWSEGFNPTRCGECPDGPNTKLRPEPSPPDPDGWIEWKGGECPVAHDTLVYVKVRRDPDHLFPEDKSFAAFFGKWRWSRRSSTDEDIIAYRVARP